MDRDDCKYKDGINVCLNGLRWNTYLAPVFIDPGTCDDCTAYEPKAVSKPGLTLQGRVKVERDACTVLSENCIGVKSTAWWLGAKYGIWAGVRMTKDPEWATISKNAATLFPEGEQKAPPKDIEWKERGQPASDMLNAAHETIHKMMDERADTGEESIDDRVDKMLPCFECGVRCMFLIQVYYYDLYSYYDGEAKDRLICRKCFKRRIANGGGQPENVNGGELRRWLVDEHHTEKHKASNSMCEQDSHQHTGISAGYYNVLRWMDEQGGK